MAEEKKPVKITETVLRDAHQSLIATRMTTEQMLPFRRVLGWCHIRRLSPFPERGSMGQTS